MAAASEPICRNSEIYFCCRSCALGSLILETASTWAPQDSPRLSVTTSMRTTFLFPIFHPWYRIWWIGNGADVRHHSLDFIGLQSGAKGRRLRRLARVLSAVADNVDQFSIGNPVVSGAVRKLVRRRRKIVKVRNPLRCRFRIMATDAVLLIHCFAQCRLVTQRDLAHWVQCHAAPALFGGLCHDLIVAGNKSQLH